jgi:DNA-binding CsgD family transcriptional regulator
VAGQMTRIAERDCDGKGSAVEALVRRLVSDLAGNDELDSKGGFSSVDGVLLDVEVDGVRCLLLRRPEAPAPLSPRELEIARMVAKGYPNKTIASVLDISSWTVASHLRRVFSKLGVSSRAAMVARLLDDVLMAEIAEGVHAHRPIVESQRARQPRPTQPPVMPQARQTGW